MAFHLLCFTLMSKQSPWACFTRRVFNASSPPPPPPLPSTDGKRVFWAFLKTEFCEENIEFWTACEDFRNVTSSKALASKANSIYEEFISSEAPKEVTAAFTASPVNQCKAGGLI